jgi:protein TonB
MISQKRKNRSVFPSLALAGAVLFVFSAFAFSQSDPFYLKLLEKAQKSLLAKSYGDAARGFEIAAFGLSQDTTLQARAYFCAGLAHYRLNDPIKSERFLRLGADLLGERNLAILEIPESVVSDLQKLFTFFNIQVAVPTPSLPSPPLPPSQEQEKQAADSNSPPKTGQEKRPAEKEPAKSDKEDPGNSPPIILDKIKEGDIVPLDMVHTKPAVTRRVAAVYPSSAAGPRATGTVVVNALISEKGSVINTEVIQGIKGAFGLDQAAVQAVRRWKFEPATVRGIKVKVWMPINIVFRQPE